MSPVRKAGLAAAIVMALVGVGRADAGADAFSRGNMAFVAGDAPAAVAAYESLAAEGVCSAPLFYNLGNAYYRDGKIGLSVLNLERAKWLAPNDPDIRANLRFVRHASGLYEPETPPWRRLPSHLTLDGWSWLSAVFLSLFCASLALRWLKAGPSWNVAAVTAGLGFAWVICIASVATRCSEMDRAVVVAADTPLRVAPADGSPSLSPLADGSVVRFGRQEGFYIRVRTEDGKTGWAPIAAVKRVVGS